MAASLTLGTSAAVFAAPPGSPFYNARLAIETALLPAKVDERLAAREDHLEDRLREAEAAAASGDIVALEAALVAFQAELDAAVATSDEDLARLAHLQAAIEKHVAKLQELAARLPTEVARGNALEHAIDAGRKAVEKLRDKSKSGPNRPTPKPAQGGGNPNPPDPNAPNNQNQNGERP
jgi:chromosome segregation ATPase